MVAFRGRWFLSLVLAALAVAQGSGLAGPPRAEAAAGGKPAVVVFAAASLKNALDEIAASYERATGGEVKASYAASSALARQIELGAPAQVFVSADLDWMDHLVRHGLIAADTRANLLRNRIVLVAPAAGPVGEVRLAPGLDLGPLLGTDGRLAVADVAAVPAGRYARVALERLGAWEGVKDRLAQAENVRAALALVARGEAPLGIVYRTDAAAEPGVRTVGTFPEDAHPAIVYPVAATRDAGPEARAFLAHLKGPGAQATFERHGFGVVADGGGGAS